MVHPRRSERIVIRKHLPTSQPHKTEDPVVPALPREGNVSDMEHTNQ